MPFSEWYKIEQLPWPTDWSSLFGREGPLVIEIGFGSGLFLADLARSRPDANVLGLEISIPSLRNAGRKVRREGLSNVILMQAAAPAALQTLCEPGSVTRRSRMVIAATMVTTSSTKPISRPSSSECCAL